MNTQQKALIDSVWRFYREQGRHDLPWRQTRDPYHILVSEIMLQQTQVDRVIPKYKTFLEVFPNATALARASLADVLGYWQGLGYNRRAKMLHECVKVIMHEYGGVLPPDERQLLALPGVGSYTARAILAFAFDVATPLIETNVRTVYIHHFFNNKTDITDAEIVPFITETLDTNNPRDWYYALMDYGSFLKRTVGNNISKSKHYTRQATFKGSDRQIRGAIVRLLAKEKKLTRTRILTALTFDELRIDVQLERLMEEGMIERTNRSYQLPQ